MWSQNYLLLIAVLPHVITAHNDQNMHPKRKPKAVFKRSLGVNEENDPSFWLKSGQDMLKAKVKLRNNENIAKNVIMFLGDGMSIPTVAAARVLLGGEEQKLAFEKFPISGLSKTYCINTQVADSACSATAYLCGVKARYGTIGVTGQVDRADCNATANGANRVYSIADAFQKQHRMTGLVTTTRVTHASPAGVYAHVADRDWETDRDVLESNNLPEQCPDIAAQLIRGDIGPNLNVILGGGRAQFTPSTASGARVSNKSLIDEWIQQKEFLEFNSHYVSSRAELLSVPYNETDFLLGLFNDDHMEFNLKRNRELEPSLAEMTESAIKILQKSLSGYFLFVEGGKIDMGHHNTQAKLALDETLEFSKAIEVAVNLTNEEDTLIVVTSDHAHTMSYSGYAERGTDILGFAGADDNKQPYTTLSYANGPGAQKDIDDHRLDINNIGHDDFMYPGIAVMKQETHGGDDVGIFARGPWAHLFTGVLEQNAIPHLMSFAACAGDGLTACDIKNKEYDLVNTKDSVQHYVDNRRK